MECMVCGKGPADGVTVFRQNPKGEIGIWACAKHSVADIDPEVQHIVNVLEDK